jgi:hypothetical protein
MGYKKATPFKMAPKTPLMKALVGNQKNLPQHLQEKILAAPETPSKMYDSPAKKNEIVYLRKKDGTANPKALKLDLLHSNRIDVDKLEQDRFGIKKPKVNIK